MHRLFCEGAPTDQALFVLIRSDSCTLIIVRDTLTWKCRPGGDLRRRGDDVRVEQKREADEQRQGVRFIRSLHLPKQGAQSSFKCRLN